MRSIFSHFVYDINISFSFLSFSLSNAYFFTMAPRGRRGHLRKKKNQALTLSLAEWDKSPIGLGSIADSGGQKTKGELGEVDLRTLSQRIR